MKKNTSKGFMLVETLIVTIFVSSILIFLLVEFTNSNKNYQNIYQYNRVNDLYALNNIINYIKSDEVALEYINNNVSYENYINITNCNIFSEKEYCLKLLELSNINEIIITSNKINKTLIEKFNNEFKVFIEKINKTGNEKFRVIAYFSDSTYATVRFGDNNE